MHFSALQSIVASKLFPKEEMCLVDAWEGEHE